jgi:hypothetical protein
MSVTQLRILMPTVAIAGVARPCLSPSSYSRVATGYPHACLRTTVRGWGKKLPYFPLILVDDTPMLRTGNGNADESHIV